MRESSPASPSKSKIDGNDANKDDRKLKASSYVEDKKKKEGLMYEEVGCCEH